MAGEPSSTERARNLWAPWRIEYIQALADPGEECFLCRYRDQPGGDPANLVLWRTARTMVLLNRFPYTGGHSLVAPLAHVGDLADLPEDALLELLTMVRDVQRVLSAAVGAQGFNVGVNLGRCAGAGLPGHLHLHVVPRWEGDTNFMAVLGGVRVISQSLEALYELMRRAAAELGLPRPATGRPAGG